MRHKSAVKRARSARKRAARNTQWKTRMKNAIKKVQSATDKGTAMVELKKTAKLLDQLTAKGVIHRKKASNSKSSLAKVVNRLSA